MSMDNRIELKHFGIVEFCILNKETGTICYIDEKQTPDFTGLYFRDNKTFFSVYPTKRGPMIFYKGKEYVLSKNLTITLEKEGKKRRFRIADYGIVIDYTESPYIGFDAWSEEIDLDLFYMIEQRYQMDEFYEQYTIADS